MKVGQYLAKIWTRV